jgi:hypothetical protein
MNTGPFVFVILLNIPVWMRNRPLGIQKVIKQNKTEEMKSDYLVKK